jgi:hypothetical protein
MLKVVAEQKKKKRQKGGNRRLRLSLDNLSQAHRFIPWEFALQQLPPSVSTGAHKGTTTPLNDHGKE